MSCSDHCIHHAQGTQENPAPIETSVQATEASESKRQAQADLTVEDPEDADEMLELYERAREILEEHEGDDDTNETGDEK